MEFYKFQCLGNDYIVIEELNCVDYSKLSISLCDRKKGVGALGLIVITHDYSKYTYYNNQGIISNRIGIGLMEYFEYIKLKGIKLKKKLKFMSTFSEIEAYMEENLTTIDLGKPMYKNQILAISDGIDSFGRLLQIDDFHYTIYSVYLGEIYTIIFVDDLNNYICNNGDLVAYNKLFKKKTNVCFVKKINDQKIEVKVFDYLNKNNEFNVLALGACALVGKALKILDNNVNVYVDDEYVNVKIDRKENVTISGKSNLVYQGNIGDEILC